MTIIESNDSLSQEEDITVEDTTEDDTTEEENTEDDSMEEEQAYLSTSSSLSSVSLQVCVNVFFSLKILLST